MKKDDVLDMIADTGGKVLEVSGPLPDGSGFAIASFQLPKDHWSTVDPDDFNVPPMPFRMAAGAGRKWAEERIREAARYAIRASTMNGKDTDFDPDALVQNFVVGMLGYHTDDGLSSDDWANPPSPPPARERL